MPEFLPNDRQHLVASFAFANPSMEYFLLRAGD